MPSSAGPEDKVRAAADLSREDDVAAAIAPDILRRPTVVATEVTTVLLRRPDVAFNEEPFEPAIRRQPLDDRFQGVQWS
ncbi:DUF6192 family protein [Streptomyces sp. NPDC048710]|uniref:DUF6192 family protein n=1 Tax=unclassified Streptomyces TaxID=2593676 RepID=UPI00371C4718